MQFPRFEGKFYLWSAWLHNTYYILNLKLLTMRAIYFLPMYGNFLDYCHFIRRNKNEYYYLFTTAEYVHTLRCLTKGNTCLLNFRKCSTLPAVFHVISKIIGPPYPLIRTSPFMRHLRENHVKPYTLIPQPSIKHFGWKSCIKQKRAKVNCKFDQDRFPFEKSSLFRIYNWKNSIIK